MKTCGKCKQDRPLDDFHRSSNPSHKDGRQLYCKECKRSYHKQYYSDNKESWRVDANQRRRDRSDRLSSLKAETPCVDCRRAFHPFLMDFDHVRGEKLGNVSELVRKRSWEVVEAEIRKCDIVCTTCHRIRTYTREHDCSVSDMGMAWWFE